MAPWCPAGARRSNGIRYRPDQETVCQADGVSNGVVEQIAIAPEREVLPQPVDSVRVVAGQGLEGDRYFDHGPENAITLIQAEALEGLQRDTGIELSHQESRRQVLTRGIELNPLVGERFYVGDVLCRGVELCEPCNHLQGLTQPGVLRGLVHRAGLRAEVLEGGTIAPGDVVRPA
jgi:MOSC domain-containing protein YiiM